MGLKILGLGFIWDKVNFIIIKIKNAYLRDSWNFLDFIIVVSAYIPYIVPGDGGGFSLSSLRALRILRPLKTI